MFMLRKVFRRNASTSLLKSFNIFASPNTHPADLERVNSIPNLLRDEPRDHIRVVSEGQARSEDSNTHDRAPKLRKQSTGDSVRCWDILAEFPDPPETTIRLVTPRRKLANDSRLPLTSDDGLPILPFATPIESGCREDKKQEPSPCDARATPTSSETTCCSSEPESAHILKQDAPEDSKRKSGRQPLLRSFLPASFSKPKVIAYAGMLIKSLTRHNTGSIRSQSTSPSDPNPSSSHVSQLFDNEMAPAPPCNECKQRVLRGGRQQVAKYCWCLGDAYQDGRVNLVTESPAPGSAFSSSMGNRLSNENLALVNSGFSNEMTPAPHHGYTIRLVRNTESFNNVIAPELV